jgi:hypothetical protein
MSLTIKNCTFAFQCPMKWDALRADPHDAKKRHCDRCKRPVFLCTSDEELNQHVKAKDCIAIERQTESGLFDMNVPLDNLYVGEIVAPYPTRAARSDDDEGTA